MPSDLRPAEGRETALAALREVQKRFKEGGLPVLDPREDLGVDEPEHARAARRAETVAALLAAHPLARQLRAALQLTGGGEGGGEQVPAAARAALRARLLALGVAPPPCATPKRAARGWRHSAGRGAAGAPGP